ncbi:MAG: DMT family transporter [Pseudooceanicola sp.]|nr:DMT family transporter [Pseudooceanicola sp.]
MSRAFGLTAAALTGVQVGLAMVATRALAGQVAPFTLALLRYAVGVAVLTPFFLRLAPAPLLRADRWPVLGLGIVQFGVLIALLNAGLHHVSAAQGSVLFATFPILTILLGALFGSERLSLMRLAGAGVSIAGIAICLGLGELPASLTGTLMVLAAALSGAFCAVFYRPYLQRYPTLQVGTLAMMAAVLALIPGALLESPLTALPALPLSAWGLVLFIGLSSGAGYLLWLSALKHARASEATILMGLSPVTAVLVGHALLDEPLTAGFAAGLALVLLGVSLAVLARR